MTLHETIKNQIKEALRAKDTIRLDTLRGLNALFMNEMIAQKQPTAGSEFLPDDKALALIKRSAKQRNDSIEQFTKGNRPELAEKEKLEAAFLEAYLPQPLSPAELDALVRDAIAEAGATSKAQMGAVMKLAVAKAAGRADGKAISAAVSAALP